LLFEKEKMKKILLSLLILYALACNKNKEYCWQVYDSLGNVVKIECDKTEAEMEGQYGPYYDRVDAKKYCWKIQYGNGSVVYPENVTEKMANIFFAGAVSKEKFTCGYCQKWMSRGKDLYKPTGNFIYQSVRAEVYCGDTCNTLFQGRVIILRDTPDSLITVEFIQKL
jgi:hypothetical protein